MDVLDKLAEKAGEEGHSKKRKRRVAWKLCHSTTPYDILYTAQWLRTARRVCSSTALTNPIRNDTSDTVHDIY